MHWKLIYTIAKQISLAINEMLNSFHYIHISMVDDINLYISLHITHRKQDKLYLINMGN